MLIRILLAALLATSLLSPEIALAQVPTERASAQVMQELDVNETARVMVVFDVPEMRSSSQRTPAAVAAGIASARADVLSKLAPNDLVVVHRFNHVNAFAGELGKAGLAQLLADPTILRIDLDEGGGGHMDEARPLATVDTAQSLGFSGVGVTVAVLDSGYDSNHADLDDDLVGEACFCSGGGGCCPSGGFTQTGVGSAEDDHGHGTNVAGVITSRGTIAPLGGAPNADIVAVKVLDSNNSFCCASDVVAGLDWVLTNRPDVDVVNMSLGTASLFAGSCDTATSFTIALATAANALHASGVPVFVSSGNNGSGTQMNAPACLANTISVGAVWDSNQGSQNALGCTDSSTAADQVTCFSNSNSETDLFAPGARTLSTGISGGISNFVGTSQASPLVASCAALMLEADPTLSPSDIQMRLTASLTQVTDTTNGLSFPRLDCADALKMRIEIPALTPWAMLTLAVLLVGTIGLARLNR